MYYYVFEQARTNSDRKMHDKIRLYLGDFGITGEFCTASPARSAEELVDMGLRKGVSTIIAIGSERHINHIVNIIKTVERGLHRDVVLGVVPTDKESSLRERLRLVDIREACEALKYRRFTMVDVGYIEGACYFLTSAEIHINRPTIINIKADRWESETVITDLMIYSDLTFNFYNSMESKNVFSRWMSWLANNSAAKNNKISLFRAKTIRISGEAILSVMVEGETVVKTPIVAYKLPKSLKLIIKRDRFTVANEKTKE
jgi:diacylglycerol kinase family enzyme